MFDLGEKREEKDVVGADNPKDDADQEISELNLTIDCLVEVNDTQKNQLISLTTRNDELNKYIVELKTKKIKNLYSELTVTKKNNKRLNAFETTVKSCLRKMDPDMKGNSTKTGPEGMINQLNNFTQKYYGLKEERIELSRELTQSKNTNEKLTTFKESVMLNLKNMDFIVEDCSPETDPEELKHQLANFSQKYQNVRHELAKTKNMVAYLERDNSKLNLQIKSLKKRVSQNRHAGEWVSSPSG